MFEQNPILGPGTGTTTTHTLEILVMLAGAFLLGLWLGWLLWNRFKAAYDLLLADHESVKASLEQEIAAHGPAKLRLAQYEADQSAMRGRIDSLTADLHDSEARVQNLNQLLSRSSEKAASLEAELAILRPAEIPMEVVESPVDVHVESLVEELPAAVEEPAAEAPVVEPVVIPEEIVEETLAAQEPPTEEAPVAEQVAAETSGGETPADVPLAAPIFSFTPSTSADDLRIIEGIGPKIEQVLNSNGISTFRQLAQTTEDDLRSMLAAAGGRYKMHDPSTWPEQARLAEAGDWEALKNWQEVLKGGRETGGGYETTTEGVEPTQLAENQPVEETEPVSPVAEVSTNGIYATPEIIPDSVIEAGSYGAAIVATDDLKVVEGIGPKIEELLIENGITTFSELAATPVARLKEILDAAGPRFAVHDPGTWPAQSLLAANGEWENLKAYQGFLNAGKRPE